MKNWIKTIVLVVVLSCVFACSTNTQETNITLALAASLKNVFEDRIIPMYEKEHVGVHVIGTYDGSGKLQTQIEHGLEADVFFSAGKTQMDALVEEGYVDNNDVVDIIENKLVLIKAKGTKTKVTSMDTIENAEMIAIGDPESVPVGLYAKEALVNINKYDALSTKVSLGTSVTEVLSWVTSASADVGFVYATDVKNNEDVEVIEEIQVPTSAIYPVATLCNAKNKEEAEAFVAFLQTKEVLDVLEEYGFTIHMK